MLAYELASGIPPFSSRDRQKTKENIKRVYYNHPHFFSSDLKDFIDSFLKKSPQDRMSMKEAIKHPFIVKNEGVTELITNKTKK